MLRYPADPAQCFYFNHFDRPVTRLHLHSHHIQTSRIEVFERFDHSGFENVFCDTITLPSHKTVACNIHVFIFLHVSVYTFVNFDSLLCIPFFCESLVHCSSRNGCGSSNSIRGAWCFYLTILPERLLITLAMRYTAKEGRTIINTTTKHANR